LAALNVCINRETDSGRVNGTTRVAAKILCPAPHGRLRNSTGSMPKPLAEGRARAEAEAEAAVGAISFTRVLGMLEEARARARRRPV